MILGEKSNILRMNENTFLMTYLPEFNHRSMGVLR